MVVMTDDSLTERKKIMRLQDTGTPDGRRDPRKLTQLAAELLYGLATSGYPALENDGSVIHTEAEMLFRQLYRSAYADSTSESADRVRDLLSELGPDDGYSGSPYPYHGIEAYHWGALREARESGDEAELDRARDWFADEVNRLIREALDERDEHPAMSREDFLADLERSMQDALREFELPARYAPAGNPGRPE